MLLPKQSVISAAVTVGLHCRASFGARYLLYNKSSAVLANCLSEVIKYHQMH